MKLYCKDIGDNNFFSLYFFLAPFHLLYLVFSGAKEGMAIEKKYIVLGERLDDISEGCNFLEWQL